MAAELYDPREDIYTLDDGTPLDAAEIYLASFPFGDVPGMKLRPVLLLTDPIDFTTEILVAYISIVTLHVPSALPLRPRRDESHSLPTP